MLLIIIAKRKTSHIPISKFSALKHSQKSTALVMEEGTLDTIQSHRRM